MAVRTGHAAAGLAALALVVGGCTASGKPASGATSTLVVWSGQSGDFSLNFNPYSTNIGGVGSIFEPLFYYNTVRADAPKPLLGTAYAWNTEGTRLSITLRSGVAWSDGVRFTAQDVLFTLNLIGQHADMNGIGYDGKASAPDDTHVVVAFDHPSFAEGPEVLGRLYVVPEHKWTTIAAPDKDAIAAPVGTGPYLLGEFKRQAFTLKANPHYWGGEPAVKQIRFLSLSGNQAGQEALKTGQVDWQTGPVPDIKGFAKDYPGYQAVITPVNQIVLDTCADAALGCAGPQTDPAVRQAIYYGLNRAQLNALAFENTSSEISPGFALPGRDGAVISKLLQNRVAPMQPDVAKAQRLLESAGYTKGTDGIYAKGGKQLALSVKTVAGWTDYITAINTMSQQLKQIGIKLDTEQLSWNEWSDARGKGDFQLIIDSLYQGPAPDVYYPYSYFFGTAATAKVGTSAISNWSRYSDPQVDQALTALTRIDPRDTAARQPYLDAIQNRIEQTMPYIPVLTQGTITEYHSAKFTGWPTQDNLYAFPAIWASPDNAQVFKQLKPAGS
jgi:peptide/nickel transport system substrate-binding protein